MQQPIQVTFRNMDASDAVEANIRERIARLETFYDKIQSCRVVVEAPHRHHRKGTIYRVSVDLTVPGGEIVVNREAGLDGAHQDVYVAIRDAFDAARRRVEDFARRQRGETKRHSQPQEEAAESESLSAADDDASASSSRTASSLV